MRKLLHWFHTASSSRRLAARRNRVTRPMVEHLEDRNLMSVVYGGGPLLPHVQIETVFYGQEWYNNAALYQSTGDVDGYFSDITQSSYMDMLNEYGIGRGNFTDGVINLGDPQRGWVVDDSEIQSMLDTGIHWGYFDAPTANRLYFVFTAPNVLVTAGNADSQTTFLGYHSMFNDPTLGPIYYAVIPHPVGNGDIWGFTDFQQQTAVSSHELAEAVTDPDCQTGWQDATTGIQGEIGDLAVDNFGLLHGYVVQAEYSNYNGGPIIPYDATPYYAWGGFAAVPATGQGQPGGDSSLSISLSGSIPASDSSTLSSATSLSLTLVRTLDDTRTDAFFATLASRKRNGTDAPKPGSEQHRADLNGDWLTFRSHRDKGADAMADPLASDLAALPMSSV